MSKEKQEKKERAISPGNKLVDAIVYKSNAVVESSYLLNLGELRLILSCISQINSKIEIIDNTHFEISANDYAEMFNVSKKHAYFDLIDAVKSIYEKSLYIDEEFLEKNTTIDIEKESEDGRGDIFFKSEFNGTKFKTRWISHYGIKEEAGTVSVCFAPLIRPFLCALEGHFTKYKLDHIAQMTSVYAIRLYEFLAEGQFHKTGGNKVSVRRLREALQIGDKYSTFKDFNARVLKPSIEQIILHSNISEVEVQQERHKRNVTDLIFSINFKAGMAPTRNDTSKKQKKTIPEAIHAPATVKEKKLTTAQKNKKEMFARIQEKQDKERVL